MIIPIARKEFTELLRDGRFRWAAVIILALLIVAIVAGACYQRDLVAQQRAAETAERNRWLGQTPKNPHSAAHYGLYAFKPRLAPAFLDPGVEPYTGVTVWLEAHKQNELLFRPAEDATLAQRFGDLTVSLVLQVVLPLAIVLLTFGAFAGERERGTLRQLLAVGLRPRDLVLGKLLGSGAALGLIVLPAILLGAGALALTGPAGGAGRFTLLSLVYLLWLAVFLFIALGVSARAPSPRFALVVLLGFWAINCLLAPRALSDFAARLHPLPEPVAFKTELKEELGDPHGAPAKFEQRTAELMKQRGVSRPEDLGINLNGLRLQTSEEHSDGIFDKFYPRLFSPMEAQNSFLARAGAVFPLLGVQSLSMGLAGTDFAQHRDFLQAAEAHRRAIQVIMNEDIMAHPLKPGDPPYLAGPDVWAKVPHFHYQPRGVLAVLSSHGWSLALLAVWLLVAGWFALRSAAALRPV
jgi:ABC-2 type transport system permease protein